MQSDTDIQLTNHIRQLADKYETAEFRAADPSSFMHLVSGAANQEAMAFIASCLSYGSRKQFFPKIQFVLDASGGEVDHWVRSGEWQNDIADTSECTTVCTPSTTCTACLPPIAHAQQPRQHEGLRSKLRHDGH